MRQLILLQSTFSKNMMYKGLFIILENKIGGVTVLLKAFALKHKYIIYVLCFID